MEMVGPLGDPCAGPSVSISVPATGISKRKQGCVVDQIWIGMWVVPVVAFFVGHLASKCWRLFTIMTLALAPIALLTIGLAVVPASPPSFLAWWAAGLVMTGPLVLLWAISAILGYAAARWIVG